MERGSVEYGGTIVDVEDLLRTAWRAGGKVMEIYGDEFGVDYKADDSPLTEADRASHAVIVEGLEKYGLPLLSEEGKTIDYDERKGWKSFWMIDPLDGTKEFVKRNGEFTINIALIHEGEPLFGVVYAPAISLLYWTEEESAYKAVLEPERFELSAVEKLPLQRKRSDELTIVASRSHLNEATREFIEHLGGDRRKRLTSIGSSLKLCLVAEGSADLYPRLAPTMEWDTAAADAVARKAGARVCRYTSPDSLTHCEPLRYNKADLHNPFFVVGTAERCPHRASTHLS